jgi:hypothetical protein
MCVTEKNHQFYLNSSAVIIIIGMMLLHLLYWLEIDLCGLLHSLVFFLNYY